MKRALALAQKGEGRTRPNPLVGAVVVRRGKVVGEGYHSHFGGPHAEIAALRKAGRRARGAVLYVTLEPCATWGKTPPCVDAVIQSGISRVVIGARDPNPENHRKGIQKLREAGIAVTTGVLAKEAEFQNAPFFKAMQTGFPYVTLKMAQSLDGKIATRTGASRWISSKAARALVHRLRSEADAILVGKNTALQDNPRLRGNRRRFSKRTVPSEKPWRVVLDPNFEIPRASRLFQGPQLTFVAVSERRLSHPEGRRPEGSRSFGRFAASGRLGTPRNDGLGEVSLRQGRILLPVPKKKGRLDMRILLRKLVSLGVQHLLVEGGGEVAWSFLAQGFVDRLIWIVAPKIIGGRDAKTSVEGEGISTVAKAFSVEWEKVYPLGPDWVFEAKIEGGPPRAGRRSRGGAGTVAAKGLAGGTGGSALQRRRPPALSPSGPPPQRIRGGPSSGGLRELPLASPFAAERSRAREPANISRLR